MSRSLFFVKNSFIILISLGILIHKVASGGYCDPKKAHLDNFDKLPLKLGTQNLQRSPKGPKFLGLEISPNM